MRWGFVFLRPREKASWPPRILTGMDLIFLSLFFYDGWEKRPERIAEIYDAAGLEGSVIRRPCENRWTDRRPPAQTA